MDDVFADLIAYLLEQIERGLLLTALGGANDRVVAFHICSDEFGGSLFIGGDQVTGSIFVGLD